MLTWMLTFLLMGHSKGVITNQRVTFISLKSYIISKFSGIILIFLLTHLVLIVCLPMLWLLYLLKNTL